MIKKQARFQCDIVSTNRLKQPRLTKEFAGNEFAIQVENRLSATLVEVLVTAESSVMDLFLASYTPIGEIREWYEDEPVKEEGR